MMNEIKKNELTEQEVEQVTGGIDNYLHVLRTYEEFKKQEEARQKLEAMRQANQSRANQPTVDPPTVHAHGGGVSGSW